MSLSHCQLDRDPVAGYFERQPERAIDEGDIDAARTLVEKSNQADLFLHPAQQHLFADSSLPSRDAEAAGRLMERVLCLLVEREGGVMRTTHTMAAHASDRLGAQHSPVSNCLDVGFSPEAERL